MKCLILAAGYATRLYPLTENFPKPLLKVGGKTIVDWLIDDIGRSGEVDEFVIVSNHKFSAHFRNWAGSSSSSIKITVVDDGTSTNETRLGAVKDIHFAVESLGIKDDLLILAGDNLLDFSLCDFIRYAKERNASCVMRYYEQNIEKLKKCGVLSIDGSDRIISMEEKPSVPQSHWCCPPFYFYKESDMELIPKGIEEGCGTDAPGSFVAWLCSVSPVYAMEMPGSRYDIGTLESYRHICETFVSKVD